MPASDHIRVFENAFSADLCAKIIARFDQDPRVAPDPQPDYSKRTYLNISQCSDWLLINAQVCRILNELTAAYFQRPPELAHGTHHEWSDDGYVVARYAVGDTCIMHVDGQTPVAPQNGLRLATFLVYLNDVDSGGETAFPLQERTISPALGRAIIFPVGFTHPHAVLPAASPRYILQTWITDPDLVVGRRD